MDGPGHVGAVDILRATQQGAAPARCGCRLECTRWGAQWRQLANTTEPSVCGGDAALCQMRLCTRCVAIVVCVYWWCVRRYCAGAVSRSAARYCHRRVDRHNAVLLASLSVSLHVHTSLIHAVSLFASTLLAELQMEF